jgi:Phage endonuclease I
VALTPALRQAIYRNKLEEQVGEHLRHEGVEVNYEASRVPYLVPARTAHYVPDFQIGDIIIETKGYFGRSAAGRLKYLMIRDSNPKLDIRFVFANADKYISKNSDVTYGEWAAEYGFKFSTKGIVPASWINDLKEESKRVTDGTKRRKRS